MTQADARDSTNVVVFQRPKPPETDQIEVAEPSREQVMGVLIASLISAASKKYRARIAAALAESARAGTPEHSRIAARALQIIGER